MFWSITNLIQIPSTSGKIALVALNLFLSALQVDAQLSDSFSEEEVTGAQRQMIQKFTGVTAIREDVYLPSRSTAGEREEVAAFLYQSLAEDGLSPERHQYKTSNKLPILDLFFNPYKGTNVYTIIPATVPSKEYVLLGAHYDSEPGSPGANDNATGVSLVYQVALQLKNAEYRGRNFIIVFFDQEEDELIGSKAFARKMLKEGKLIHSVHTADMIGWDADRDGAIELEYPTRELRNLYEKVGENLGIPLHITQVTSTDHEAFREQGYPAVGVTEEYVNGDSTPHYHKASDTAETVDFDFLLKATRFVWFAMQELAESPQIN
ncbi:MAG: Zn-dependent exopeptidase M28 [Roseivirga sp.]|nr:Zn-dependent exopeptidase M28 [Roseivirga sp.]